MKTIVTKEAVLFAFTAMNHGVGVNLHTPLTFTEHSKSLPVRKMIAQAFGCEFIRQVMSAIIIQNKVTLRQDTINLA